MAIVWETPDSGTFDGERLEIRARIDGTSEPDAARWELIATAPLVYAGLTRKSVAVSPIAPNLWDGTVTYERAPRRTGDVEFSFAVGGESGRRRYNIATRATYAKAGFTAPNFYGAIGVRRDGGKIEIEGVEIDLPQLTFTIKLRAGPEIFTPEYTRAIFNVKAAPVNATPFFGFQAREVRLTGVQGGYRSGEDYGELTFSFAASPNATNLQVGAITNISKYGWDYLDVYSEERNDPASNTITQEPLAVYVHQVYAESDFSVLGLE